MYKLHLYWFQYITTSTRNTDGDTVDNTAGARRKPTAPSRDRTHPDGSPRPAEALGHAGLLGAAGLTQDGLPVFNRLKLRRQDVRHHDGRADTVFEDQRHGAALDNTNGSYGQNPLIYDPAEDGRPDAPRRDERRIHLLHDDVVPSQRLCR